MAAKCGVNPVDAKTPTLPLRRQVIGWCCTSWVVIYALAVLIALPVWCFTLHHMDGFRIPPGGTRQVRAYAGAVPYEYLAVPLMFLIPGLIGAAIARRLRVVLVLLLPVMAAALAVIWFRTHEAGHAIRWQRISIHDHYTYLKRLSIEVGEGGLSLIWTSGPVRHWLPERAAAIRKGHQQLAREPLVYDVSHPPRYPNQGSITPAKARWWQLGGFDYRLHKLDFAKYSCPPGWACHATVPLALPIAVLLLPSVWGSWRVAKKWLRERRHRCPQCSYDLRGTPMRCPECGHLIPIGR